MTDTFERNVTAELVAVLIAVTAGEPRVLTTDAGQALPAGPFELSHRSLQAGMRDWVETQTHHPLGYVEQLYTFADRDRSDAAGARVISVSYLGLTREAGETGVAHVGWQDWYRYFPWEDHRAGRPAVLADHIEPALNTWIDQAADASAAAQRRQRVNLTFGLQGAAWNEDMLLQRYELLFEAGLVPEAQRRGSASPALPGQAMHHDHRRILATGMARLRAKIKYRPVVFELMPPEFTLLQLQLAVEALAGRGLHKQNFRRLIEQQDLVEETGGMASGTAGRPAKLFRFRRDVLAERAIAGSKLPLARQV
ncbi:NrtR DNA-binding winged helix domain-containing protein [Pseudomonadota bacterium AL_CKDN230030165-1A_HGKHYDSX7]